MRRATVLNFLIAGVIFWCVGIDGGTAADRIAGAGCVFMAGALQILDVIGRIRKACRKGD